MKVQLTIVGLGQIGSSIGLAFKAHGVDVYLVGHDKDPQVAKESHKAGAVDNVKYNLPASVREAKVVVLALPLAAMRETLELIAPDLQEGCLVLDTAPSKATVAAWVQELLPPGRYYVGLTPAINPEYLHGMESGVEAARADLFEKGLMAVNAPPGTPGEVFNLAMDLVYALGARPLLMDTTEADGLFSAMHILPQLAAAALLDATVEKPGWQEARKLAGRPFASVTAGAAQHDDMLSLEVSALENRENVVRLLNAYITSLIDLRDEIAAGDRPAIQERLENARTGRLRWWKERRTAEWLKDHQPPADVPSVGERLSHMFFGRIPTHRQNQRK